MYRIYIKGQSDSDFKVLHNPNLSDSGYVVIAPALREKLNTHGLLTFSVAPTNPLYDELEPRNTKVRVISDTSGNKYWFGRVISMERGWNNCWNVECEGELGCLNDSIYGPFGYRGTPSALFSDLIGKYNQSNTRGYTFSVGNVSVTDPNDYIVRCSNTPATAWKTLDDKLFGSSLGGYVIPRYDTDTDTHYVDYLALDEGDQYAHTAVQTIEFGKNLLNFVRHISAEDVVTVLIPYGAQLADDDPNYEDGPPEPPINTSAGWAGNRLTIASANSGRIYLEDSTGISAWGRIVGYKIWDDVTVASNLKKKAQAWLAQQIWQSMTLEVSAVDLAFVNTDIEQIQVGDYVRVKSQPHDLNVLLLCSEKTTYLTELENSAIVLGAGLKTITDLQSQSLSKEGLN